MHLTAVDAFKIVLFLRPDITIPAVRAFFYYMCIAYMPLRYKPCFMVHFYLVTKLDIKIPDNVNPMVKTASKKFISSC